MTRMVAVIRLAILLAVAFIVGATGSFVFALNRSAGLSTKTTEFTVEKGQGPRTISARLGVAGLLQQEKPFLIYVLLSNKRNSFYPGLYEIPANITVKQLVDLLTSGKVKQYSVTILEGWRISDIATEVAKKTKVTASQFLAAAPVDQYEGYLFPDTYTFTPETTAEQIVKIMHDNWIKKTTDIQLTPDQVKLASIVEREAKTDEDRAMVAGVYSNRLKIGMALQADPTVQYAKGSWAPITLSDYQSTISAYNTYLHQGLPPTPISNPGLASLKAAKNPATHDYYFFFHTSDGKTYYSKTGEEHNAKKRQYL